MFAYQLLCARHWAKQSPCCPKTLYVTDVKQPAQAPQRAYPDPSSVATLLTPQWQFPGATICNTLGGARRETTCTESPTDLQELPANSSTQSPVVKDRKETELSWHPTKALTPGDQNLPVHFSVVHFFEFVTPHSLYLLTRLTWKRLTQPHSITCMFVLRQETSSCNP